MPMRKMVLFLFAVLLGNPLLLPADRAEGSFERTLTVSGAVELRVSTGAGSIQIRKGPAGSVRVVARIRAQDAFGDPAALVREVEQNPPISQSGNAITLGDHVRRWNHVSISYDLTVPEETQASASTGSGGIDIYDVRRQVDAATGSGSIQIERVGAGAQARTGSGSIIVSSTGGSVTASTGSGRIELTGINGRAEAQTGSGGITVIGATGAVRARAASGHVRVEKAVGDVTAESASGGVEVDGAPKSFHWELSTASGNVRVSLPRDTPFELDAHSSSGSITTSHPLTVSGTIRRNELRGVSIRPENHIRIRAASGSVRVD